MKLLYSCTCSLFRRCGTHRLPMLTGWKSKGSQAVQTALLNVIVPVKPGLHPAASVPAEKR